MAEPCRHVPPCATPAVHRGAQRADWRKALAARAAAARTRRGRRQAGGLPRGYRLPGSGP